MLCLSSLGQDSLATSARYITMGFGGQSMVSVHYEAILVNGTTARIGLRGGAGLNENGDEETGEYAVYCLIPELIGIYGKGKLQLEGGLSPTAYFHNGTSFINLNGLLGLRFGNANQEDFYVSIAYTPRLQTTSSNSAIQRIDFGLRIGIRLNP